MKKRTLSFFLCLAMVISLFVQAFPAAVAAEADGSVAVLRAGEPVSEISIAREEKTTLTASFVGAEDCQWQILLSPESDQWVDIYDKTAPDCEVSYALVKNLLDDSGSAYLRCAVTGETTVYSDPVCVNVLPASDAETVDAAESAPLAPAPLPAPEAEANEPGEEVEEFLAMAEMTAFTLLADEDSGSTVTDEDKTIYTVTIEYVYGDSSKFVGQRVALPYIAEVAAGDTLDKVVDSPECVGYLPDYSSINLADLGVIEGNISRKVEYSPAEVSYTVRHYQQNVDDDEYTHVDTTLATGYTESLTSDAAAKTYTGFTALTHFHEEIAADGSTMIDIYYDREYYFMSFDLGGGYGVDPIYARYGTPISVGTPYKAGWTFDGWNATIPTTMPAENTTYTAKWNAEGTTYTIVYWNADLDDGDDNTPVTYSYWGSKTVLISAGEKLTPSEVGEEHPATSAGFPGTDEAGYYSYNKNVTAANNPASVEVAGDGSTAINVYYNRRIYEIRFIYARSYASNQNTTYQIATLTGDGTVGGTQQQTVNGVPNIVDDRFTQQTESIGTGYTYYYVSLTAEFGANIENLWPAAAIGDATNWWSTYNWGSWAAEKGTGYRTKYGNEHANIVGAYPVLSADMIKDPNDSVAQRMTAWWGNNQGIENHAYHIYYQVLPDEEYDAVYDGKYYKLDRTSVFTAAHNGTTRVDPFEYTGFTIANEDENTQSNSNNYENNKSCPDTSTSHKYCNIFYYDRDVHTLSFYNYNEKTAAPADKLLMYGESLKQYQIDEEPEYPQGIEAGSLQFVGWYTTPECHDGTEVVWNSTMPAANLTLYAKWVPVTHDVSVYLTAEDAEKDANKIGETQKITHDEFATAPTTEPKNGEDEFIGWFYKENGVEKAFDFAATPITADMTVYAKWRSNASKDVTIHYVVEDENGNQTTIADSETIKLRVGQTRTFDAKTGVALYADYRTGCFPTTATHSITPTETSTEEDLTYTFVYKKYGKVPYQVKFTIKNGETTYPAFKVGTDGAPVFVGTGPWNATDREYFEEHWDNDKAVVVELFEPDVLADEGWVLADEYLPNALKLQKVIVPSETDPETNIAANTIEFIYTYTEKVPDPENPGQTLYPAKYLVQHFIQNVPNTTVYDLYSWSTHEGLETKIATASPITIPGYTFSSKVTNEKKQADTTLSADNTMSGTITADDKLELNFYYTANAYPYRVLYLEEGTNQQVADPKTTNDQGDLLTELFGATVKETASEIEGYDIVGDSTKSIQIKMEAGTTAQVNTITFYYERKNADLIISKTVKLDEEQAKEVGIDTLPESATTQEFSFNIFCPTGFNKSVYDYTVEETGKDDVTGKVTIDDGFNMTVTLKHGQTIQIHELIMGTYTITETYVPGFRITVDDGSDAQQKENVSITAKLVEADQDVQVDFVNSYPFFTGDLVLGKTVKKADEANDPDAKEPYKVTVTLTPEDETREVDRTITWTDADNIARTYTVPALTGTNDLREFTFDVLVPVGGTVTLSGVPAGGFIAEETTKGDIGYITDYYKVQYSKELHKNETTETALGAVVNGVVHGGHPTAVTFTNTYKKGDLTIHKTVKQEYENDNWDGDTFTFAITGTTELPDGEYAVTVGGEEKTVTVSNHVVTVGDVTIEVTKPEDTTDTSWKGSLAIENLPAGYYTVTEASSTNGLDKYTVESPAANLLVNNTTTPTAFNFTNTYKRTTGSLQISKEIEIVGDENIYQIDKDQEFTFTVSLTDGKLEGAYKINGSDNTLTVNEDGTLTFDLKHKEFITISGLPVGKYEITEASVDKYAPYFTGNDTDVANATGAATVTTGSQTNVECTNKFPVDYGTLMVEKEVVTPEGFSDSNKAPDGDVFTFTVKISDYSTLVNLNGGVKATFHRNENTSATVETLSVENDTLTFELEAGQSVVLELPACNYTVTETGMTSDVNSDVLVDHYTTKANDTESTSINATLVSGGSDTVTFTNTYKRHYANLTINNTDSPGEPNQVYVYEVKSKTTDLAITVTVVGNGETTIHDLPVGEYTVTQQNDWSWRYSSEASDGESVKLDEDKTLSVTQSVNNGKWLDGVSDRIQNVKGG